MACSGAVARFIVFEGGEAQRQVDPVGAGWPTRLGAVHTREPGGTAIGRLLRELLLDARTTGLDDRAEALLMAADRAQHVAEVVRPALAAGRHVVSDRYVGSIAGVPGVRPGLPVDDLRRLSAWAIDGLWPDLVVLLDVPRGWGRRAPPVAPIAPPTASRRRATTSTTGWPRGTGRWPPPTRPAGWSSTARRRPTRSRPRCGRR